MKRLLRSTIMAWVSLLITAVLLVITFIMRPPWWGYIYIFFLFLCTFCHAVACSFARMAPPASRSLDRIALVCGILAVVAIAVQAVVWSLM